MTAMSSRAIPISNLLLLQAKVCWLTIRQAWRSERPYFFWMGSNACQRRYGANQVSRRGVRWQWHFQRQIGHEAAQPSVLTLQIHHPARLINLQAAVLLAPPLIALLGDLGLPACQRQALALCCLNLDLAQHEHYLPRARFLTSPPIRPFHS